MEALSIEKYGFSVGDGLYTDMNAIRRDEDTSNIHSICRSMGKIINKVIEMKKP